MIKDYDLVFCDLKEALDKFYKQCLVKNYNTMTKSPKTSA